MCADGITENSGKHMESCNIYQYVLIKFSMYNSEVSAKSCIWMRLSRTTFHNIKILVINIDSYVQPPFAYTMLLCY